MERYKSSDKDTGVVAYRIGDDDITIEFRDGSQYLYSIKSAGPFAIREMKSLAKKGTGLTTYINQNVKDKYERKLK